MNTERLIIRQFEETDINVIFHLSKEKQFGEWLPDQVYESTEQAEKAINFLIHKYDNNDFPYVLAVVKKETGELIGHVGASKIAEGVEIGYAIGEKHQRNGYAKEAVKAFAVWSKEHFDLAEMHGVVDKDNEASQRVLESIGFVKSEEKNGKIYFVI